MKNAFQSKVIQCFVNADLRSGHDGLSKLARKHGLDVETLLPGEYLIFVNSARNRLKLYAASNVIAYLKADAGQRIDLNTIREIPRVFNARGKLEYETVLKEAVTAALARKSRGLEYYAAEDVKNPKMKVA